MEYEYMIEYRNKHLWIWFRFPERQLMPNMLPKYMTPLVGRYFKL